MANVESLIRPLPANAFSADSRWSSTATNGPTGTAGKPITLTYSFVPDYSTGDPSTSNVLHAEMNAHFGSPTQWKAIFRQVFDGWEALSGVRFVETVDDGAVWPDSPGLTNVRGDVRIVSFAIDGVFNVLAYNYFPNTGDMALDSAEDWSDPANNYRFMRNVLMHELGHGLGLNHVLPRDNTKLMEALLSLNFDGPQDDDVRGAGSLYGDPFEGNDTLGTAGDLGEIAATTTFQNLSLHAKTDVDWFKVALDARYRVAVTATPVGGSYSVGPDPGSTTAINTAAINPLRVEVYNRTGVTMLGSAVSPAAGQPAAVNELSLASGEEEFRVKVFTSGSTNALQRYSIAVALSPDTNELSAHAGLDRRIEEGDSILLSATATGGAPPYSYRWSPSTGLSNALIATPTASPAQTTTYTVTVTDALGASDDDDVVVTVTAALAVDAGGDKLIRPGQTFNLQATATGGTPPYSYRWTPTTGLNNAGVANPSGVLSNSIAYTVTVTDVDGNEASDSATVSIVSTVSVAVAGDRLIPPGGAAQLTASVFGGVAPYSFAWSPNVTALTSDASVVSASPTQPTSYSVLVTDGLGQTASAAIQVFVSSALNVSAGQPLEIDPGEIITLDGLASGGLEPYQVLWSPSTGLSDPTVLRPIATPDKTTVYTLQVSDSLGQSGQASVQVSVRPAGRNSGGVTDDPDDLNNTPPNPCGVGIFIVLPLMLAGISRCRSCFWRGRK